MQRAFPSWARRNPGRAVAGDRPGMTSCCIDLMSWCNVGRMIRTQIQLTERQAEALRQLAAQRRTSMAELIRGAVDRLIEAGGQDDRWERALAAVGAGTSDRTDVSDEHDRYLADAYADGDLH